MKVLTALAALKTPDPASIPTTSTQVFGSELFLGSEEGFSPGAGTFDSDDINGRAGLADLAKEAVVVLVNAGTTSVTLNWVDFPFDGPDRLEARTAQDVQDYVGTVGVMAINAGYTAFSVYTSVDDLESTVATIFTQRL